MGMNINKVMLHGNLTRDPELKEFGDDNAVCKIGLATNREWKDANGEKQKETTFHNLVIWGKRGKVAAQYMKKGDNHFFEGRLVNNDWVNEAGEKRTSIEVIVEDFKFGYNKSSEDGGAAPAATTQAPTSTPATQQSSIDTGESAVEDLPF